MSKNEEDMLGIQKEAKSCGYAIEKTFKKCKVILVRCLMSNGVAEKILAMVFY